ncbi:hypothetical protein LUTEI9C_70416 [Luteimonas sp. 9C]|nr:hypothetical protein LUTEI9C_70416 [Luteimonas sp. 9C]
MSLQKRFSDFTVIVSLADFCFDSLNDPVARP